MYLVMILNDNRVNHIMPFDPSVWEHPESAWQLACDYANQMVAMLGFDPPSDHWVKNSNRNEFRWEGVSVVIERAYTPIRDAGVISVAKAYADGYRMQKEYREKTMS